MNLNLTKWDIQESSLNDPAYRCTHKFITDMYLGRGIDHAKLPYLPLPEQLRCDNYFTSVKKLASGEWMPLAYYFDDTVGLTEFEKMKLVHHLPHVSVNNPNRVAFYQSPEKLRKGIETPIKPAAYYKRYINPNADDALLSKITEAHAMMVGGYTNLLGFMGNDDVGGWEAVYSSSNIRSCMNNGSYNLTLLDSFKCYCTSSAGLSDNGLRLAWLANEEGGLPEYAVARAIVHQPTMTYIRVYGDDRLSTALEHSGYTQADAYPEGLILATWLEYSQTNADDYDTYAGYLHPYIDGSLSSADFYTSGGEVSWFELICGGDYELDSVHALVHTGTEYGCECYDTCPIRGYRLDPDDTYEVWYNGEFVQACYEAYEDSGEAYYKGRAVNVYDTDDETVEGYTDDGEYEFYIDTSENHEWYGLVWSSDLDCYICGDRVVRCEAEDDYTLDYNAVCIDGDYYLLHGCEVVFCETDGEHRLRKDCVELGGIWFAEAQTEEVDGKTVPVEGLDDNLREEILNG